MTEQIREALFQLQDQPYRELQRKVIPTAAPETLIGVRTPALRQYARQLAEREDISPFLRDLPHAYFDENQLHAFIISEIRDYGPCIAEVQRFLPYVDNWATCDQLSPRAFRKHRTELLACVREWLRSSHPYTVRFAIGMLMQHYLDEDFDPEYPELVAGVRSDEYYGRMMIAWYFATALAKQYDAALPYLEEKRLAPWTHNKTIRKAIESDRVAPEQKAYLRSLQISGTKDMPSDK